ncbi:MAG TPA: Imm74 family immunity protein [Methylovirgula sp.]|nr:Imm74 family immunity protein [Methylovirgula sp.]
MSSKGGAGRGRPRLTVEITEGAFRVTCGAKSLTIFPEPDLPGAAAPADFVVRLDEVLTWDPPHEDSEVEVEDLQRIAAGITAECERRGLTVAFE